MNKTIYEIIEEISLNSKFTHTCYSPCLGDCSVALIKDRKKILIHKIGEPSISLELNENGQLHKEGELMLFPDKEKDKSWNAVYKKFIQSKYDVKHLMMVSHNGSDWSLRRYLRGDKCYDSELDSEEYEYIVPVEDFNFKANNLSENAKLSISSYV
jgi:hypothetical protein